jgi:hypothetical protein
VNDPAGRPRGGPNRRPVRVFISHTSDLSELPPGRSFVAAAIQAVREAGDGLAEMDTFSPSADTPAESSTSQVARCDVYVGIIGLRYGSPVRDRPDVSYTELEFETATQLGMERLVFLLDERSEDVPRPIGRPELDERQTAFRARLLDAGTTVVSTATPEELARRLLRALYELPDLAAIPNELNREVLAGVRRNLLRQVGGLVLEQERARGALAPVEVALAERPSAAYQPQARLLLRRRGGPDRPLPRGQSIDALFHELGGQLLILGEPGAGKTTLLLQLAGKLAEAAARNRVERAPVVFHLSSWASGRRRPFERWLADELHHSYGVSAALSRHWIEEGQVTLLLDGLDEVDPAHRDACVDAINAFRRDHTQVPLVVCSRTDEFEALRSRLHVPAAIVLLPLEHRDVEGYLGTGGPSLAGVLAALRRDEALWDLLTTPLILNVVAAAYRDRSPAEGRAGAKPDELRTTVLSAYVGRMLERFDVGPDGPYGRDDLLARLRWLATAMTMRAQSVLHVDLVQPDWLPTVWQRRAVTIGVSCALGLVTGVLAATGLAIAGSPVAPGLGPGDVLVAAAIASMGIAIVSYRSTIEPTAELGWSWPTLRRSFPGLLGAALATAIVLGPVLGALAGLTILLGLGGGLDAALPAPPLAEGLLVLAEVAGTCAGLGLVVASSAGIDERYAIDPPGPGRAVRATGRAWLVSTVALGLPAAALFLLAIEALGATVIPRLLSVRHIPPLGTTDMVLSSLAAGLLAGLAGGLPVRMTLPAGQRPRPGYGLLAGLAAAAILGPAQLAVVRALTMAGIPFEPAFVPWVPDWAFASAVTGLSVAVGGSLRTGIVLGLIGATASAPVVAQGGAGAFDPGPVLVVFAIAVTFGVGLRQGGGAFLRHWALRWWLARARLLPLDAAGFLELATRLGLLRRRGGGHQFFHRLLQEHLSNAPDSTG